MRTPGTLHEAEENYATTLLNMTTHTTTSGGAAHLAESHPEHGAGREAEAEGLRHGTQRGACEHWRVSRRVARCRDKIKAGAAKVVTCVANHLYQQEHVDEVESQDSHKRLRNAVQDGSERSMRATPDLAVRPAGSLVAFECTRWRSRLGLREANALAGVWVREPTTPETAESAPGADAP